MDGYDSSFSGPLMSNLAVSQKYRRKGLAEDLVKATEALARRDLMTSLREQDWGGLELPTGGPPPMNDRNRGAFSNALDRIAQKSLKEHRDPLKSSTAEVASETSSTDVPSTKSE